MDVLEIDGSKRLDVTFRTGASFIKSIRVYHNVKGVPFDFSGYTLTMDVYSYPSSKIADFSGAGELVLQAGLISLSKSPDKTKLMRPRGAYYILWATTITGEKYAWLTGKFTANDYINDNNGMQTVTIIINDTETVAGSSLIATEYDPNDGMPADVKKWSIFSATETAEINGVTVPKYSLALALFDNPTDDATDGEFDAWRLI